MWPCVTITASNWLGLTGRGMLFKATMSCVPWKRPQSIRTWCPFVVRRCLLPVTVPAAPINVISATALLQNARTRTSGRHRRCSNRAVEGLRAGYGVRPVQFQAAVNQMFGLAFGNDRRARLLMDE